MLMRGALRALLINCSRIAIVTFTGAEQGIFREDDDAPSTSPEVYRQWYPGMLVSSIDS